MTLAITGLKVSIGGKEILRGVDLSLTEGRVHGLAGESGSGKTMTGLAVLGLLPHGARTSGSVALGGRELLTLPPKELNRVRGGEVAMVFQDPATSLHPMLTIGRQLTEHMRHHLGLGKKEARSRAIELLGMVRIPGAEDAYGRFPHQFSGGMRQRIAIAIALACSPKVLIADEPTTALDVTVQAGVLRLLRGLCDDLGLAVLLVTHDLGVMSAVADEVSVMKDGLVVESGPRGQVLREPAHAYTRSLLDSLPDADPGPGSGAGSGPGSGAGSGPGSGAGSGPGSGAGSGPGSGAGSGARAGSGSATGVTTGSAARSEHGTGTDTDEGVR